MRRGSLLVIGLLVAGVALATLARVFHVDTGARSVVLVTIDTLRADRLGAYGRSPSITPHLDALAASGTVFTRCWTTAPLTVPAHASILTGLSPPLHGLRTNEPGGRVPAPTRRPYPTLAEVFKVGGATTAAFISSSVLRKDRTGLDWGFDVYDEVDAAAPGRMHFTQRRAGETVEAALAWVSEQEGPFFLWIHLFDPHAPYDAPPPYGKGPAETASARGYDGEVEYVDHCVGKLIDGLAAAGHGEAILAVTSDHGEGLGAHGEATHGWLLHEETLHVPLIVKIPGAMSVGRRRDDTVSVTDIPATLATLAGLAVPKGMASFPLFTKQAERAPRPQYAETLYGYSSFRWAQMFAVRHGDRKLVDAGPFLLSTDLAADPAEDVSIRSTEAAGDDGAWFEQLRTSAGQHPQAELAESSVSGPPPGYIGSAGGPVGSILAHDENRVLPSPYDRMEVLRRFDRARTLLQAGRIADAVLEFEALSGEDPGNPQVARWLGRALFRAGRPGAAAQAYRTAFDLGWRSADCLSQASRAALQARRSGEDVDLAEALAFLERARGKGALDDGFSLGFEAMLLNETGDGDGARRVYERALDRPMTDRLTKFLAHVDQELRKR